VYAFEKGIPVHHMVIPVAAFASMAVMALYVLRLFPLRHRIPGSVPHHSPNKRIFTGTAPWKDLMVKIPEG
jgi:hypothetical protein